MLRSCLNYYSNFFWNFRVLNLSKGHLKSFQLRFSWCIYCYIQISCCYLRWTKNKGCPHWGGRGGRNSRSQIFFKIGNFKNLSILIGKYLCLSLFLIKLQVFSIGNSEKKRIFLNEGLLRLWVPTESWYLVALTII